MMNLHWAKWALLLEFSGTADAEEDPLRLRLGDTLLPGGAALEELPLPLPTPLSSERRSEAPLLGCGASDPSGSFLVYELLSSTILEMLTGVTSGKIRL